MKKIIIVTLAMVLCVGISHVQAAIDWDFYEDGTIQEGDDYANVRLFDTPPDNTTVDMTGGSAYNILTYDSSTLNVSGGETEVFAYNQSTINVSGGTVNSLYSADSSTINAFGGFAYTLWAYDTGTVNVWGNADVFSLLAQEESSVVNMWGGEADRVGAGEFGTINLSGGLVNDGLWAGGSGIINVFGYDLSKISTGGGRGYGFVSGQWEDSNIFTIDFGSSGTHSRVILHEIPEPATLVIIMTGILFFRKRQS